MDSIEANMSAKREGAFFPSAHARHFGGDGRIIFRNRRDASKLRMDPKHVTPRKIHQHGEVKHHAVAP